MDDFYSGNRRVRRTLRKGGNPPKVVVSNPKPNSGGRKKYTRKNRYRRGGAEAEQKELLDAIKSNKSLEEIQAIVSRGADVNTGVGMQAPPLTWAIHKKRLDLVKFLVENGADVNMQSPLGGLPILEAGDYPEILGFLISRGARYPAGWPMSARTRKTMEKQGAIEVGVKKDLPTPIPSIIKGFLGARRRR